ncbi:MAG: hybrid sensor histidine kinase/response regulator [Burkholderiales bacterium PBB3]|nr:MAG: hybrid sensor histidine kinase/response regulator [Burkholderiales bacterium PBB3]
MLCGNVGSSVIPTLLLVGLLFGVLSTEANRLGLGVWSVATVLSKLANWMHARHQLTRNAEALDAPRLVWELVALNALDGAIWGSLAWFALDSHNLAASVLTIAVLTGVASNSMSLLAPVLPVYVAFVFTEMVIGVSKLFLIDAPGYQALGYAGFLYFPIMVGQCVNNARVAKDSIVLRFENIDLIEIAERARKEAEQANMAKSTFLAAASHDLRQPIHAQGLFLEALAQTELTSHQCAVLASARSASVASGEMLNTLLDFSRIEAGVVQPFLQPFELQALLHTIENDLASSADAKGLVYRSRETNAVVHSDGTLVELILRNLVSNAIRYTEKGGVLVGCRLRGDHVSVEIWDTGPGIAPKYRRAIFQEFHQLGNPERDRRKGLGLGLAIVEGLTRALGHRLSMHSVVGRGSVFKLDLPLSQSAVNQDQWAAWSKEDCLKGLRVLVIDDDEAVRSGMVFLLQSWGCHCDAAGSISEALALASANPPDIVISDYRLREQSTGSDAIAAVRRLLGNEVSALLITGDTAPERLREALASGMPLLHKPVTPDRLRLAIETSLNTAL